MKSILGQLRKKYNGTQPDNLKHLYQSVIDQNNNTECFNIIISMADPDFVEEIYNYCYVNNKLSEQIVTAMVRVSDIETGLEILENTIIIPHVRTFVGLVDSNLTINQYNRIINLINKYEIVPTSELFSLLVCYAPPSINTQQLIEWAGQCCTLLSDNIMKTRLFKPTKTEIMDNVCSVCNTTLNSINLNDKQRQTMINTIGEISWFKNREYDIVIDGANVAHYNNSVFNVQKVINMVNMIKNKKILIVFSICRKKATKSLVNLWNHVDIYYTKPKTNDDLMWLYAGIYYLNIYCITNDQMRDHIYYKFLKVVPKHIIELWKERTIVNYCYDNNNRFVLIYPKSYSNRSQISNNNIHIPTENGWICGTI